MYGRDGRIRPVTFRLGGETEHEPSFLHSDRVLARAAQPFVRFLHIEAAGGILLVAATVVALVWANSPWRDSYESLWSTTIGIDVGSYRFEEDLAHVVNDLFMALFFFVVGMEIKRELVVGELRDRRAVALPAMAALGGMVVPAVIYAAFNAGGDGVEGWGIPMATDIAFAVGIVALLGSRVPTSVKVRAHADPRHRRRHRRHRRHRHLLQRRPAPRASGGRRGDRRGGGDDASGTGHLRAAHRPRRDRAVDRRVRIRCPCHDRRCRARLLTPARPTQTALEADEIVDLLENRNDLRADEVRATARLVSGSVSACDRLIDALHPWTSFVIVPVFALANAGIQLSADAFAGPSHVLVGVALALVVGKLVGITGMSWLAVRLGLARLPAGAGWRHIAGVGAVAGIGFTVSLFITGLAFNTGTLQDDAKIGILIASISAAIIGATMFVLADRRPPRSPRAGPAERDRQAIR
jgi:Na+:H+ antiporter, NhaA family